MKHFSKCLLALLCINTCLILYSKAQTVIHFDFKTKQFTGNDAALLQQLKLGDFYQIQISNINSNLYKVSIGKRDTVIYDALTTPTFAGFSTDVLQSLVGTLTTGGLMAQTPIATKLDITAGASTEKLKTLMAAGKFTNAFKSLASDNGLAAPTKSETIIALMFTYETVLKESLIKLIDLKRRTDELINNYNQLLIQAQIEQQPTGTTGIFSFAGTIDDLYIKFNAIRKELNDLNDVVEEANTKYTDNTKQYADDIKAAPNLTTTDGQLKSTYTVFSTTISKATDAVSTDNEFKYITSITAVVNNQQRAYLSMPLQFTKDQNILVISVLPRSDNAGLHSYATALTFPIKQNSFWAISSGIYWSSLYNKNYSILKTIGSGDTTYTIKSENPSSFEFGVNTIVRYGWSPKKNDFYWQAGFGPGVTVSDKVRARVMAGLGFAKGNKHKFVIDMGIISGYTDELSVVYKENTPYSVAPGNTTVSKLNFGVYGSIGYLFY